MRTYLPVITGMVHLSAVGVRLGATVLGVLNYDALRHLVRPSTRNSALISPVIRQL